MSAGEKVEHAEKYSNAEGMILESLNCCTVKFDHKLFIYLTVFQGRSSVRQGTADHCEKAKEIIEVSDS